MLNYEKVYTTLCNELLKYVLNNNLKALVLGISGGIDSTVCAAICRNVADRAHIPFIGRSITIETNTEEERRVANLVGKNFCTDFKEVVLDDLYDNFKSFIVSKEGESNKIALGNIKCRLRMIYLYHLAHLHKGITIDTDNRTEHNLGFFTVNGDVFDYNPIGGLWKTEVYELAKYLTVVKGLNEAQAEAVKASINLTPTDGLGISSSDLEQIGCKTYKDVDEVLQASLIYKDITTIQQTADAVGIYNFDKVIRRHNASEFKRKPHPIVIPREMYD